MSTYVVTSGLFFFGPKDDMQDAGNINVIDSSAPEFATHQSKFEYLLLILEFKTYWGCVSRNF